MKDTTLNNFLFFLSTYLVPVPKDFIFLTVGRTLYWHSILIGWWTLNLMNLEETVSRKLIVSVSAAGFASFKYNMLCSC